LIGICCSGMDLHALRHSLRSVPRRMTESGLERSGKRLRVALHSTKWILEGGAGGRTVPRVYASLAPHEIFFSCWGVLSGQERPKSGQERPKSGQERPKSGQERPKSGPRAAKSGFRTTKSDPRAAKSTLRASKSGPRAAKSAPRAARRVIFHCFSLVLQRFCENHIF
jgi:hypothetical protein